MESIGRETARGGRRREGAKTRIRCVLLAAAGLAARSALALPADDQPWIRLDTEHFTVISGMNAELTKKVAHGLEAYRQDIFGDEGRITATAPLHLKVLLFPNNATFADYRPGEHGTYLQPGRGVTYLVATRAYGVREQYTYFLLGLRYPKAPLWLQVGLEEVLRSYARDGEKFHIGFPVRLMHEKMKVEIPFDRFLEVTIDDREVADPDTWLAFRNQAWLTLHYLMIRTGTGQDDIVRYLKYLGAGVDRNAALEAAFGLTLFDLEAHVRQYGMLDRHSYLEFEALQPEPELPSDPEPLSRAELLAELGGLQVALARTSADGRDEWIGKAESHFRAALAEDPRTAAAHSGLGLVARLRGDRDEAAKRFRAGVDLDPQEPLAHYLLAENLLDPFLERKASLATSVFRDPPPEIVRARRHLERCRELRPGYVDARLLHAYTFLLDPGDPGEGIAILEEYLPLLPGRRDVVRNLLTLHLKLGNLPRCFDLLDGELRALETGEDLAARRASVVRHALRECERRHREGKRQKALDTYALVLARTDGVELDVETESRRRETGELLTRPAETRDETAAEREAYARHRRFLVAWNLSAAGRLDESIAVIDELLAGEPPDSELRVEIQWLKDRIEYRAAYDLYADGRYLEARRRSRAVAEHGVDASVRTFAESLVALCDRRLRSQ